MDGASVPNHPTDPEVPAFVSVTAGPIDLAALVDRVRRPAAGAIAVFLGTVRDHAPGRTEVTHLEYEAYEGVVEEVISEIVREAGRRWEVEAVAAVHRLGPLEVLEASVGVAVSSAHRPEAFAAARYVIDELKRRAPIWKKEHWSGGAEWVREGG